MMLEQLSEEAYLPIIISSGKEREDDDTTAYKSKQ
jgi:hypothetical protein